MNLWDVVPDYFSACCVRYLKALEDILPTPEGHKVVVAEAKHAHPDIVDPSEDMLQEVFMERLNDRTPRYFEPHVCVV